MFTIQKLKEAHSRVKTGVDFPRYIQEIKKLGLIQYEFFVKNGAIAYYGANHQLTANPIYDELAIATTSSPKALQHTISIHQQGQTDFLTFCDQAAKAGVEKWVIDTEKMLCTYYDLTGNEMVTEPIPQDDYE